MTGTPTASSTEARVRVLRTQSEIAARVRQLGLEVARDHAGDPPLLIGVLKGAFAFVADLARATPLDLEVDFLSVSSYGRGTTSSGTVRILADLRADIAGRPVVVCEGVVDSGRTLSEILEVLRSRKPASLRVATLFDKRPCREVEVPLEYVGWTVGDEFLVGYGLDVAERYRNLPYVGVLEEARTT